MVRSAVPFVVAVCAFVPGCLAQSPVPDRSAPDADGPAADRHTLPFGLTDCQALVAMTLVPSSRVASHLPPGFAPFPFAGAGLPERVSRVGFEADRCASALGANRTIPDAPYAAIWVRVVPPPHLAPGPGVEAYVSWDWIDPDPVRRIQMAEAGFPAFDGTVSIAALPVQETFHVSMDGGIGFQMSAGGEPELPTTGGGRVVQFVAAEDGTLSRWEWAWRAPQITGRWVGALQPDPDHWTADLLDGPAMPTTFIHARWSYTDGVVAWPLAP